jgi:hypothetical protein
MATPDSAATISADTTVHMDSTHTTK